jgi:universal stress protein A
MQIRKILVPTDFSSCAEEAVQRAIAIAKTSGAEIHLLHAYQIPIAIGLGEPIPMPQQYFDQLRAQAEERLRTLSEKVRANGVNAVTSYLAFDSPARAILDRARDLPADLVVIGTRGLTGMKHVLLGSVAERVVRLAHCDVLTVKESAGQDA